MAQRKPYNPNTKYGRRNLNEAHYQRMAEKTPEERAEIHNCAGVMFLLITLIGGLIVFALFGGEGLLRWLGGKRPY
ncbi:hypothetical protein DI53_1661 [Sphingobacterium deserti]|uniref:Uncharacterized protein n=1 Tax=Sphingobacterium deserti TaxID=1229276 RepID=A0A0B8T1B1_9SPHI|nr:hypothetical protein DI53_1661 [Sphingobacterium deserti]